MTEKKQDNTQQVRYSGFWVRGAAYLIDHTVLTFIIIAISIPVGMVFGFAGPFLGSNKIILQFMIAFLGLFIMWTYFVFMTYKYQATLGKMAVGVKVQTKNGGKLSLKDVMFREIIGKFISSIIFGIGYVMIAFTQKKQGLHDFMVKSVVVYNDVNKGPNVIVIVITYIAYSIISFFGIIFITLFARIFGFLWQIW